MALLFSQFLNGLQTGSIYALVALGYSMVYGIILLLNFAHGDIIMVGAYAAYYAMIPISQIVVKYLFLLFIIVVDSKSQYVSFQLSTSISNCFTNGFHQ